MRRTVLIFSGLLLALCWQPVTSCGQTLDETQAFVTRWRGEAGKPIKVPLYGRYTYRWEKADGTEVKVGVASVAEGRLLGLPVPKAGEYVLKAGPKGVKRIEFGVLDGEWYESSRGTPRALLRVEQWGRVAWESFAGAFYECENMSIAEGAGRPDLSGVASMHSAFEGCSSFNSPIGDWDVSNVTSMQEIFKRCSSFNQPLEQWDVSNVTDMEDMFSWCRAFNQPLEKWDVSRVTNMREMFYRCSAFNRPLAAWDVSNVTDMGEMFKGCRAFNQPLGTWDVSKVTVIAGMFSDCSAFSQPLEKWDVSRVTNMSGMFYRCSSFNQPLEKWDVSRVTSMREMFKGCYSFNQPLEKWDVSRVTSMREMFDGCSAFNQPLGGWTPSALKRNAGDHDLGMSGSGLSVGNYSATLEAWAAKGNRLKHKVRVKAEGLKYSDRGKLARQQLKDDRGWVFVGDRGKRRR